MPASPARKHSDYLILVLGCVLMGTVGIFANKVENTHPLNVVFLRVFFAFLGVLVIFLLIGKLREAARFFREHKLLWFVAGLNMVCVMVCYLTGTILFSVGLGIVLLYTAPIWLVAWHAAVPRKGIFRKLPRPSFGRDYYALVAVNLAGLAILVAGTLGSVHIGTSARFIGFVLAAASGILFAGGMLILEVMKAENVGGEQMMFSGAALGTLILLPMVFFLPIELGLHNLYYAIPMGIVSTAIGGVLYFSAFEALGPRHAPVMAYIEPLVGVLLGMIILLESYPWYMYIGIVLILCSGMYESIGRQRSLGAAKTDTPAAP